MTKMLHNRTVPYLWKHDLQNTDNELEWNCMNLLIRLQTNKKTKE